jgi:hypothetical protein
MGLARSIGAPAAKATMREPSSFRVKRTIAALIAACDLAPRLDALYEAHPGLGVSGFEDETPTQRPEVAEVRRCLYWLVDEVRLPYGESSYGLKHAVERWGREVEPTANAYTSNGAMIAALLLAGWPVRRRGLNARVAKGAAALGTTNRETVGRATAVT